jgi:arylsulfatase A-like enzyme
MRSRTPHPRPRRLACALALALGLTACGRPPERPHVLFVLVDTLRRDHLGFHGRDGGLTPNLDALAAGGSVFERHVAHASQTVPSVLSLLLSQLPAEHGFPFRRASDFVRERPRYPESSLFLAEVFQHAGYATAGFVGNPYLGPASGFGQGFERFGYHASDDPGVTREARRWLAERDPGRPFFLYLHYMGPHQPYDPPESIRARFVDPSSSGTTLEGNRRLRGEREADLAHARALYAACVAAVDDEIGAVLRELDRLDLRRRTLVVFTSDHGEEFGEHGGIEHGRTVYGEVVQVPLVLSWPGRLEPGRRVAHLSQHLDVAPTVLRLAGLAPPSSFRGASLLEPVDFVAIDSGPWRAVQGEAWKLVWHAGRDEASLFAADDPLDARPVEDPAAATALRGPLEGYLALERAMPARASAPPGTDWTVREREQLRALGYGE